MHRIFLDGNITQAPCNNIGLIKDIAPYVTVIITVIIAFNQISRELKYKRLSFLSELDKMLIEKPQLWLIYDANEASFIEDGKTHQAKEQRRIQTNNVAGLGGKLDAYCYLKINNFERIFKDCSWDSSAWDPWDKYIEELMMGSYRFRDKAEYALYHSFLSSDYSDYLKNKLKFCYEKKQNLKKTPYSDWLYLD